jgi:hypothetical protein
MIAFIGVGFLDEKNKPQRTLRKKYIERKMRAVRYAIIKWNLFQKDVGRRVVVS